MLDFVSLDYPEERAVALQNLMAPQPGTEQFTVNLVRGLNMISVPLMPETPYTAKTFAEALDATIVIRLDEANQRFVGYTVAQGTDGFSIEGGKGYIVNTRQAKQMVFTGTAWKDEPASAAPVVDTSDDWAFVVSGTLIGNAEIPSELTIWVHNVETGRVARTGRITPTRSTLRPGFPTNSPRVPMW